MAPINVNISAPNIEMLDSLKYAKPKLKDAYALLKSGISSHIKYLYGESRILRCIITFNYVYITTDCRIVVTRSP